MPRFRSAPTQSCTDLPPLDILRTAPLSEPLLLPMLRERRLRSSGGRRSSGTPSIILLSKITLGR